MRTLTLSREQTGTGPLILVNPSHPLHQTAAPELRTADSRQPDILLERKAAGLLNACIQSVGGQGQIVPVSGWRSQAEQQAIWDDTLRKEGADFTRRYVAIPGCSEHQTGLAIDLGLAAPHIDFIRPHFPDEGVCGAFRKAAARYGFIQRYQKEKEDLTQISEEPWHFRYVGAPHAALLTENGLCLEEYRDFVRKKPRLYRLDAHRWATVYHLACRSDTMELTVPERCCCQLSGDNDGGFFLTVWGNVL
jgi:D-alanyl-D-alanine dipeptidase/carboxypeptidase